MDPVDPEDPVDGVGWVVLNGTCRPLPPSAPATALATYLRDGVGLVEVKVPCGEGACGACTVLVDDRATLSCLTPLQRVAGHRVSTVSFVSETVLGRQIADALVERGAFQCGYCTPGWLVAAYDALSRELSADDHDIRSWLEDRLVGHLCRCTGYRSILDALVDVVARRVHAADPGDPVEALADSDSLMGGSG